MRDRAIEEGSSQPPMPFLPEERIALTPSASQESLALPKVAIADSPFFRLPAELRRQILIEAFGGRVVHMDLMYDHPHLAETNPKALGRTHCGRVYGLTERGEKYNKVDETSPKAWHWYGSVCHTNLPYSTESSHWASPALDCCLQPRKSYDPLYCGYYPGEAPAKCFVGAMGWLLSCRQA